MEKLSSGVLLKVVIKGHERETRNFLFLGQAGIALGSLWRLIVPSPTLLALPRICQAKSFATLKPHS
jgi:hypothetical protein